MTLFVTWYFLFVFFGCVPSPTNCLDSPTLYCRFLDSLTNSHLRRVHHYSVACLKITTKNCIFYSFVLQFHVRHSNVLLFYALRFYVLLIMSCNFMSCNFDGPSFSCPSFSVNPIVPVMGYRTRPKQKSEAKETEYN